MLLALPACRSDDDSKNSDSAATASVADSAAADAVPGGAAGTPGIVGGATSAPAAGAFLDPDAATREQLLTVPGMTAALADSVVARRPYANMTAVDRVLAGSLSEAQRDTVYTRLWKPLDLNSATGDEITLIPGVGARMRHEFEEYRPYQNIERFRREIGKYVDKAEVARLERYVTIR
jgi:DNA uptake protein ComE-like DNA-binding protein